MSALAMKRRTPDAAAAYYEGRLAGVEAEIRTMRAEIKTRQAMCRVLRAFIRRARQRTAGAAQGREG